MKNFIKKNLVLVLFLQVVVNWQVHSAPSSLTITELTSKSATLNWEAVSNGFVIENKCTDNLKSETVDEATKNVYKETTSFLSIPIENIVTRDNSGFTTITQTGNDSFNFTKRVGQSSNYVNGVYIKIEYENLSDLNKNLNLNLNSNGSIALNSLKILDNVGDWGAATDYAISLSLNTNGNNNINLYDVIMASSQGKINYYTNANSLQILLGRFDGFNLVDTANLLLNYNCTIYFGDPEPIPSIVAWGDSLTAGGGWTTTLQALSGMPVYNGGTGGENSKTIMARQGADPMIVNNVVIPATTTPIILYERDGNRGLKTQSGNFVMPLLQGGSSHVNPCVIEGVEGTLKWTGIASSDMTGSWTFTRLVAGNEVAITSPVVMRTAFDRLRNNDDLAILFMGQNGGYANNEDLINQHKLMINHANNKNTIILGLSSGTASSRAAYETAMKAEFGDYFISLREYLTTPIYAADGTSIISCVGLDDAELTPTQSDIDKIAIGQVPPQLLSDGVHYTAALKTVIGNMLYKKLLGLNIFSTPDQDDLTILNITSTDATASWIAVPEAIEYNLVLKNNSAIQFSNTGALITGSGAEDGKGLERLIDGDLSTNWSYYKVPSNTGSVTIQYTNSQLPKSYSLKAISGKQDQAPTSFTLQGSADGITWTTLDTKTSLTWSNGETKIFNLTAVTDSYNFYKYNFTNTSLTANHIGLDEIMIYGIQTNKYSTTSNSYAFTGLNPNTNYYATVQAYNAQNDNVSDATSTTFTTLLAPIFTTNLATGNANYTENSTAEELTVTAIGNPKPTYQWYMNTTNSIAEATAISGATILAFSPTTATIGTNYYFVRATNSEGTIDSNIVEVIVSQTMSSNRFVLENISIFPNPAENFLNIQLKKDMQLIKVNIYTQLGQFIRSESKSTIDVSNLSKGIYFIEVETTVGKASKTILIK
jgi:hypothetical protein